MTNEQMHREVEHFIKDNFVFDDKRQLKEDETLLGAGIVDSTGVLEIIAFLENTYQVRFDDQDLVAENFDSVSRIVRFMSKKLELAN